MNSLPIPTASALPSGNSANTTPANAVSPKQGTAQRNGTENDAGRTAAAPGKEPFAILLAKQVSEMDMSTDPMAGIVEQSGEVSGGQDIPLEAAATDPAATVTAMLLQIPQEQRATKADPATSSGGTSVRDLPIRAAAAGNAMAAAQTEAALLKSSEASGQKFADLLATQQTAALQTTGADIVEQPLPPALAATASAANRSAEATQTVSTPVGSPAWANDFAQKVTWMSSQQNQTASLHLNPPNLGPLDVVLKITDNQATALFTSPHGAVREAIENAMPKLREMLADNGIMLGDATVSDQSPRDRDAAGTLNQGAGSNRREAEGDGTTDAAVGTLSVEGARAVSRHNGMVDTFA